MINVVNKQVLMLVTGCGLQHDHWPLLCPLKGLLIASFELMLKGDEANLEICVNELHLSKYHPG